MSLTCRKNCVLSFDRNSSRVRHENEKCSIYGGEIDKRKKFIFKQACELSMKVDGTLLHASKFFKELMSEKEIESNKATPPLPTLPTVPTTVRTNPTVNNDHSATNIHNTQITNNNIINNDHSVDNTVNTFNPINCGNTNVFVQLSQSEWEKCSKKERNEITAVLRLFRENGCTTAEEIQNVVLNKYPTIQQMEQNIKSYKMNVFREIAMDQIQALDIDKIEQKDRKLKDKIEHFQKCIIAFYDEILFMNGENTQVTTDMLLACPIFKLREGGLKVWNKIKTKQGLETFGKTNEEGSYPGWTTMQESKTWRKIILIITLRFIQAFEMELNKDSRAKRDDSEELEEIAKHWYGILSDNESKKNEIFDQIGVEMSKKAALASSLEPQRGWYRLTDVVAEVEYRLHNLII